MNETHTHTFCRQCVSDSFAVMPPCVYLLVTDLMIDGLRGMFCMCARGGAGGNVNVGVGVAAT